MKKIFLAFIICTVSVFCIAQSNNINLSKTKDSTLKAAIHEDSLKIDREFAAEERWDKLFAKEEFPVINAGKYSGIFPVKDITEVPDPKMQYKLLYEMTQENSDSALNEPDHSLVEIVRLINLHVGSGIPLKNISVVVVTHGPALHSISTDKAYQQKFKMNNPNLNLIKDLEKAGVRFIACGQSMLFMNVKEEDLIPRVKISLTAQTALTGYQLKGYVLKSLDPKKR